MRIYKSAYSWLFDQRVKIIKIRLIEDTYIIYDCKMIDGTKVMFCEHELRDFKK